MYEAYTHQSVDRDSTAWGVAMGNCNFVRLFALAVAKAGNNLTSDAPERRPCRASGPFAVAQWGDRVVPSRQVRLHGLRSPQHWDTALQLHRARRSVPSDTKY